METSSQEKYRSAIIEKYEQRAWECLALYNYYGRHYANIEENCKELDRRIQESENKINSNDILKDRKERTKANNLLKEDISRYKKQIESVGELGKKFFEKATAYQEEGGRILEQIEDFKVFKLKTPSQIAEEKISENKEKIVQ